MEERQCEYRNCNKDISDKRKNAKYCCREHKTYELIYRKRRKEFIENCVRRASNQLHFIKVIKKLEEL